MINTLGKGLALTQVALSVVLLAVALAMYFGAIDFGWKQPARYWREIEGKTAKGSNLLIPSLYDKREAAMRQMVRAREDQQIVLSGSREKYAGFGTTLGDNHLKGLTILAKLENEPGNFDIFHIKIDNRGELERTPAEVGFPAFAPSPVPGIKMSYAGYRGKLQDVDDRIRAVQSSSEELLKSNAEVTLRLLGEMDKDGNLIPDGRPGWNRLLNIEYDIQQALQKEIDYIQPLWVNERAAAELVISRRESLLRRLEELGDKGYMTQSEFLQKAR